MAMLLAGLALFIGIHMVPSFPAARERLIAQIGSGPYKGLFSLVALAGLALLVLGYARAPYSHLWDAPSWGRSLAPFIMLPAIYCFVASNTPSNIKRLTRNPQSWGVILWGGIHLLNNGDVASLLLFGGLIIFAVITMWSNNRRPAPEAKAIPVSREAVVIGIAALAYIGLVMFHPAMFGVAVM